MVEFTLPANSRVRTGKTFKAAAGGTRVKSFTIYGWIRTKSISINVGRWFSMR